MDRIRKNDSLREATAGACAGAITRSILAPIDRIKLMMQLKNSLTENQQKDMIGSRRLGTSFAVARNIYEREGILAFWRGNTPTVVIQAGTAALNFMFMDLFKKAAKQAVTQMYGDSSLEERKTKIMISFLSGGLAGGTSLTLLYPIGLMRTQLALDVGTKQRKYPNGMRDVVRQALAVNGFRGLFQGYGVALASVTLYRTVYLGGYDALKSELARRREQRQPQQTANRMVENTTLSERFFSAQAVSTLASIAHYPLDSVRRRMMMQSDSKVRRYRNGWHCFKQIYIQEGLRGYYLGIGPNLIRSFGAALLLVSYDFFKSKLY